jgi:hypothetical protein
MNLVVCSPCRSWTRSFEASSRLGLSSKPTEFLSMDQFITRNVAMQIDDDVINSIPFGICSNFPVFRPVPRSVPRRTGTSLESPLTSLRRVDNDGRAHERMYYKEKMRNIVNYIESACPRERIPFLAPLRPRTPAPGTRMTKATAWEHVCDKQHWDGS